MFLIKVRCTFSCALRLYRPDLTDEQNRAIYGVCSNPSGHGHNYDLEVAVAGDIDPENGMVADFYAIQKLVDEHIHDKVDHRNLNFDVPFMRGLVPTAENMAVKFWEILEPLVPGGRLFYISIAEKNNNIVTYFGPKPAAQYLQETSAAALTAALNS
ncbi:MAG: 6-carboxytetrahydropterin synthase [Candidatus Sumerlaeaceae bacterium]|nr:6-carboxytetrahydropterin synthase [Candidatus Sumerlaeaceae bacterium]